MEGINRRQRSATALLRLAGRTEVGSGIFPFGMMVIMMRFLIRWGVMGIIIGSNRGPYSPTQRTADNRTIAATHLIANRRTGGATDTATNRRIQGGIVGIGLNNHQCNRENKIFNVHRCRVIPSS
jgi:hypothetical protein